MADLDDRRRLAQLDDLVAATERPDAKLDALVRATADAAGTPVALVSLVVQHTQLFRAQVGLPAELAASRATSRCDSFCQLVVQTETPLVVEDATVDARVPRALVERYGTRAYLGQPLSLRGVVVGSLCATDTAPRTFTAEQILAVAALAKDVSARFDQLTEKAERRRIRATIETLRGLSDLRDRAAALARLAGEIAPIVRLATALRDGGLDARQVASNLAVLEEPLAAAAQLGAHVEDLRAEVDALVDAMREAASRDKPS